MSAGRSSEPGRRRRASKETPVTALLDALLEAIMADCSFASDLAAKCVVTERVSKARTVRGGEGGGIEEWMAVAEVEKGPEAVVVDESAVPP